MKPREAIVRFRAWLGITQDQLADALGIERGTVARWEGGDSHPPHWVLGAVERQDRRFLSNYPTTSRVSQQARLEVLAALEAWDHRKRAPGLKKPPLHPRYAVLAVALAPDEPAAMADTCRAFGYPLPVIPLIDRRVARRLK